MVRSLHHIDDEDFEDTAEAGRRRREALEAQEAAEKAKKQAIADKKKGVLAETWEAHWAPDHVTWRTLPAKPSHSQSSEKGVWGAAEN